MIVLFKETGFDPDQIVWWGVDRKEPGSVTRTKDKIGVGFKSGQAMIVREDEVDFQDILAYLQKGDYGDSLAR